MTVSSFAGPSAVGQHTGWGWSPGSFEVTQGWGAAGAYAGEPAGHGYNHWHAGADIGTPCGTLITLPAEIHSAVVRHVDNPGGYGTALVVTIGGVDIWFGHLAARLAAPGNVRGGQHLALTNNTGNSTGCHVHFEVRPKGAQYGTDIDPTPWILNPVQAAGAQGAASTGLNPGAALSTLGADIASGGLNPTNPFDAIASSVTQAEERFVAGMVGGSQVALGGVLMAGGLIAVVAGVRGQTVGALGRGVAGAVREPGRRRAAATFAKEKTTQGAIARDVTQQAREARIAAVESRAERLGIERNTRGAYRAGLISQAEAQRRLSLPVQRVGRRASGGQRGYGQGRRTSSFGLTDRGAIARDRAATIARHNARNAASGAETMTRAARVRASRIKGAKLPAVSEPPF